MAARQDSRLSDSPTAALLAWYDMHRRALPWRALAGERADPYRVWLSEIMLQQTTVQAVGRYYREFLSRWPAVQSLAAAPLDEVLAAWAGLGYYARARNLHRAAKVVAEEFSGEFPTSFEQLKKLPGVGAYTAGAIAAIAFDLPHLAMDANAERVLARLFAVEEPLPKVKARLHELGQGLVPQSRAGDFAQALMDLGSAICTPKKPACTSCPVNSYCEAFGRGMQEVLPRKAEKAVRPLKRGAAFVARDASGAVLLVKRPENGLLGGMLQPPLGPWAEQFPSAKEALLQAPFSAAWKKRIGIVRHGFTHFELEIEVYVTEVTHRPKDIHLCHSRPSDASASRGEGNPDGRTSAKLDDLVPLASARETRASPGMTMWVAEGNLSTAALPTVMRKIIAHALHSGGPLFAQASAARRR
ncbi:MAG TPA: A/G-specific adenine glycosylase [Rhizomicrobium sp.]|jgi:A/G-specific adenine glycosylase|nr:A/G-specific adenine glycosylase [Rhizomicrobium sp.]